MQSVMTPWSPRDQGRAQPRTPSMTDDQTTQIEFADVDADPEGADSPTPAENAAEIRMLVQLVEQHVTQTNEILDELEQRETAAESIDTELTDVTERMFQ